MSSVKFNGNVYKCGVRATLSQKPAKEGVRTLAQKQRQVNAAHAIIGISTEMAEVFDVLRDFIVGKSVLTDEMKKKVFEELGDVLYYTVVASSALKCKVPALNKKIDLDRTVVQALVDMSILSGEMLDTVKKVFYGVPKVAVADEAGNQKLVVDKSAYRAKVAERNQKAAKLLGEFSVLLWALCTELFGSVRGVAYANHLKLAARYPDKVFSLEQREKKDASTEQAIVDSVATTV